MITVTLQVASSAVSSALISTVEASKKNLQKGWLLMPIVLA